MLSRNHPAEPVEVAAVTILNLNWISVWVVISGILDRFVEEETQPLTASPPVSYTHLTLPTTPYE